MHFGLSEEQAALRDAVRGFLKSAPPARESLEDPTGYDAELWERIVEHQGWQAMALPEDCGGWGFGMMELVVVAEELGRTLTPTPLLATLLAAQAIDALGDDAQRERWLGAIAEGATATLSWKGEVSADSASALSGIAPLVLDGHTAQIKVVGTPQGWFVTEGGSAERVESLDPLRVLAMVRFDGEPAERLGAGDSTLGTRYSTLDAGHSNLGPQNSNLESRISHQHVDPTPASSPQDPASRTGIQSPEPESNLQNQNPAPRISPQLPTPTLQFGAVLLAAELLGVAEACLTLATDYAKVRRQFGRPIGSFQSIQHMCADLLLVVESTRSAVWYAAWAQDEDTPDAELAARTAIATAGPAAFRCAGDCLQIHGGIGFTWEHDIHLYLRRARGSLGLLGAPRQHRAAVADALFGEVTR